MTKPVNAAGRNGGTVAATIITGDEWEEERIERLMRSLHGNVDGVFVDWNGKDRPPDTWWRYVGPEDDGFVRWQQGNWNEDFAAARQRSLDMVPRSAFDWFIWIDTDDELIVDTPFKELFAKQDPYTQAFMMEYQYGYEPLTGEVVVRQWRERLMRLDVDWRWLFPVHEVCRGPALVQWGEFSGARIRHHRRDGAEKGARVRNRRILSRTLREKPDDPRTLYYMAHEAAAEAEGEVDAETRYAKGMAAIELYRRFLSCAPMSDDMYNACCQIGDIYRMLGMHEEALGSFLEAIKYYPAWPEAYVGIASSYMVLGDWDRMWEFCNIALQRVPPTTAVAREPHMDRFNPLFLRGLASEQKGNLEDAIADYEECKAIYNPPPNKLAPDGPPLEAKIEEARKLLEVRGDREERDAERKRLRGTRAERSICFYTNHAFEPWHPIIEAETGAGGAETCVMELAKRFAADGWRTVVFGTPGEHRGVHEDVEYWETGEYSMNEPFTVVLASRAPHVFEARPNCDFGVLWFHDANMGGYMGQRNVKPDVYACLSDWHAMHVSRLHRIAPSRIEVVPNGVDVDRYPEDAWARDRGHRFVYSSSPDRGLEQLLGLWPEIKARWSDATLDVFYGWNIIDAVTRRDPRHSLEIFKKRIFGAWEALGREEGGIVMRGRVPQAKLAEEQASMVAWLYPTQFTETFCITAVETQLAGAIPVASSLAALNETVAVKELLVDGWPGNLTYQRRWLATLERVMEDPLFADGARQLGRDHALQYSWDNAYAAWQDLFLRYGVFPIRRAVAV